MGLQSVITQIPLLVAENEIITFVSSYFIRMTEYTEDELVGRAINEILDVLRINPVLDLKKPNTEIDYFLFSKSLEYRNVRINLEKLPNDRIKYVFNEIPNSRFEENFKYLSSLYHQNLSCMAVYLLPELKLLKANEQYLNIFDSPYNKPETTYGRTIYEHAAGLKDSYLENICKQVINTHQAAYVKEYMHKGFNRGITYWDAIVTPLNENGQLKFLIVNMTDVTEIVLNRQKIERQAEIIVEQKIKLESIIENLDLPFIRMAVPTLNVVDINLKAFKLMKAMNAEIKSIDLLKHCSISDLVPRFNDDNDYRYMYNALYEKKTQYLHKKKYVVDGGDMYWNVIFEPVFGITGEVQEVIMIMTDVTSEVAANLNMEKTLKLQEELFSNISHELKTPLNVIYTTVQLFNMYVENGSLDEKKDSVSRYLNSITQNSYRLSKLINNIVDLSKIEAGFYELNMSNNNIIDVVEEIVMSVADYIESKGISIVFDTEIEEKIIACDPEKVERIILNLLSNAIKFSEVNSEIRVEIFDREEFVEITVTDRGIGIDKKNLEMIFERFKQVDNSLSRNAEGTGIGLSLVKLLVELHEGRIYAESEIGKGSKFTVLLPSRKVEQESFLSKSKIKSKKESVYVELSDIS